MVNVNRVENQLETRVVTNSEDFASVLLLRALCFMTDGATSKQAVDGNDYQATHFLVLHDGEPIGAARVRWFKDFAKLERTCFREGYRHPRYIMIATRVVFDHIARKGYSTVLTHAEPKYAKLWQKLIGFEVVEHKQPFAYPYEDQKCVELVKHLDAHAQAITTETDGVLMARIEGNWEEAHAFERL